MRSNVLIAILGASLMTSACATKSGTGLATGAGAGAVIGGLAGGWEGAAVGGLVGGAVGYGIGRHMEIEDQKRMAYALEANQPVTWDNPETGNHYEMAPTGTYLQDGRECRNYRVLAEIDGRPDEMTGVACRRDDGSWELQG